MKKEVRVEVLGRAFNIVTPSDEYETLMQAVGMLNDKIAMIKESARLLETERIVILAALNVANELLKLTMKDGLAVGEFERKIGQLVRLCDDTVAQTK